MKNRKILLIALGSIAVLFQACNAFFSESERSFDITRVSAAGRANGVVVTISATKQIGKVEAWIGDGNWLYITIPDTNVDYEQMNQLRKSPIFSKMEWFKYNEAIQVSLQLKEKVDGVDVVRYPDDDNVYIALYRFKS